jgi:hypothetical protein
MKTIHELQQEVDESKAYSHEVSNHLADALNYIDVLRDSLLAVATHVTDDVHLALPHTDFDYEVAATACVQTDKEALASVINKSAEIKGSYKHIEYLDHLLDTLLGKVDDLSEDQLEKMFVDYDGFYDRVNERLVFAPRNVLRHFMGKKRSQRK